MKRSIYYIPMLLGLLIGLTACQRDDLLFDGEPDVVERTDDLPIRIEATIGETLGTRSVDEAKKSFTFGDPETGEPADVIHVLARFEWTEKVNDGSGSTIEKKESEIRYCSLVYTEEGRWVPNGKRDFTWPNKAEWAWFTAYYLHGSSGELTANIDDETETSPTRRLFSTLADGQDPLRAQTPEDKPIRYGHTVGLTFEHILAHLSLIELDAGIDDDLVFRIDSDQEEKYELDPLCNGFQLKLTETQEGDSQIPNLEFSYFSVEEHLEKQDEDRPQIQAPTVLVRDRETRLESRQAGFFLEPDCAYDHFAIYYASSGVKYLSYDNSVLESLGRPLQANNRYTFDVKKSSGVTIHATPEEQWDESDRYTMIVHADKFLQAIYSNSPYSEPDPDTGEEVMILERTTNPIGTLLKRNVVFETPYYHVFTYKVDESGNAVDPYDFVPSVGSDNIFDGGYHYIKGLCCPLFYDNYGVIKNLGLSDVTIGSSYDADGMWISTETYQGKDNVKSYDYSRTGALATVNRGIVQNVRVKNLTLNVGIHAAGEDTEAHDVGALFGINESAGLAEEIYLNGPIRVTVQNSPTSSSTSAPSVSIGGLAGQSLGTLSDIRQLVDNRENITPPQPATIAVVNKLGYSLGAYYIGGLVGNNTGKLHEISIPTVTDGVTVDSSPSWGVVSYIGGLVGIANSSDGNVISSCLIGSGSVKAGTTTKTEAISAYSYTGGLVGVFNERANLYNCTSFCSVTGSETSYAGDASRATGGVFGQIMPRGTFDEGRLESIAVFGETLSGANAGCFAGDVPADKRWDPDYIKVADVKKFPDIDYIGSYTRRPNN